MFWMDGLTGGGGGGFGKRTSDGEVCCRLGVFCAFGFRGRGQAGDFVVRERSFGHCGFFVWVLGSYAIESRA